MVKHHSEPFDRFQQYYIPEEELEMSPGESLRKFVWNSKEKEFCGRDAESWGKLLQFNLDLVGLAATHECVN